ncbi:MAG: P-II family nitrogen regulator [Gemmatimonadetes bacterium]|nr:P-II family nitrogen regulator [Gemmatimonadota bacterium]
MEKTGTELVCTADDIERLIEIVREQDCTGKHGDGVIFVSNIERAVKIRSGAEDAQALR